MANKLLSSRGYALLAGGFAIFLIYGSLIPFRTRARDTGEVVSSFQWAMANRLVPESRSDFAANCLLSMPLAFCLMGAGGVDRSSSRSMSGIALAVVAGCVFLAATVEFLQLYFPNRTCSGSDVLAQGLGAIAGVAAWLTFGQLLTDAVRWAWDHPRAGGRSGQILMAYVGLMFFVQMLPLDLNPSPRDFYHRIQDGDVKLIPFQEVTRVDAITVEQRWEKVQSWIELVGLYLPAGLLASRLSSNKSWNRWSDWSRVATVAVLLGFALEASQLIVSRSPSVTDVLIGVSAAMAGWCIGCTFAGTPDRGLQVGAVLIMGLSWVAVLAVGAWVPFDFAPLTSERFAAVSWVPFADLVGENYLRGLDDLVGLMVAALPLGVVTAVVGLPGRTARAWLAALVGGATVALLETGQLFLPMRSPSTTPVVLAAVGAWLAAAVTTRLRTFAEEPVA